MVDLLQMFLQLDKIPIFQNFLIDWQATALIILISLLVKGSHHIGKPSFNIFDFSLLVFERSMHVELHVSIDEAAF